jgi:hypothetical protein
MGDLVWFITRTLHPLRTHSKGVAKSGEESLDGEPIRSGEDDPHKKGVEAAAACGVEWNAAGWEDICLTKLREQ